MPRKRKWRDLIPPADKAANPLYITEHMNAQKVSDAALGKRFGVGRETAFRWRTDQKRLEINQIMEIATFLGTDLDGLTRPPEETDVDEISFDAAGRHITDPEERERVAKILESMRGSRD